jgi:hypothetical protein
MHEENQPVIDKFILIIDEKQPLDIIRDEPAAAVDQELLTEEEKILTEEESQAEEEL